jgi:hypothetical protein
MYQSSPRNNFLDILLDPSASAILISIALHATIGASLPFFTQPEPEAKKAGPTTVKVVELTPSELQRIPQAPPVPTPQVLPSTKPIAPSRPSAAPPRTTQFSIAPQTIPFSPLRPSDGTIFKPPAATKTPKAVTKTPKAVPRKQPVAAIFDPSTIFNPVTKPSKPTTKKGVKPKPLPQVSPPVKIQPPSQKTKTVAALTPQPTPVTNDDGRDRPSTTISSSPTPNRQTQQPPAATPKPASSATSPTTQPTTQPSGDLTGENGSGFYGRHTQAALKQLIKYRTDIPGLVVYKTATLAVDYPKNVPCTNVKQSPFIVYMVAFDKVPNVSASDITSDSLTQPIDKPSIFGDLDNQKLRNYALFKATEASTTADLNRPVADKNQRVLYQYRVEFDPASCKK